ncbi:hypothetical protein N7468_010033 [Penicillium chermesinum]|uniref:Fringe-like glycosyltransferase domain-containing protein n=1 Tax=Penicillium chermesinum TaxID=63820 RepID=A0A9W9TCY8_9EURO|nr:uncharacterized protein N7468_010033 [Penicillium chermesinum]KAJ5217025.1 hypothetical protein N7468_010033 [Penicillium chermesinum]KAJ6171364.1 hypothetical protein N7470_000431 [Penicillium chermesinum]
MLFQLREGLFPASWAWKKLLRFAVIFVAITGFTIFFWPEAVPQKSPVHAANTNITVFDSVTCSPEISLLQRLDIKRLAQYTRRDVIVDINPDNTPDDLPMTQLLDEPLFTPERVVRDPKDPSSSPLDGCQIPTPLVVRMPKPPPRANASHIDFGVATSISRLNESLDAFAHWAAYTDTRIFALLEPAEEDTQKGMDYLFAKARALGVELLIEISEDDYLRRYFALIPWLEANLRAETQWACIIDDDTFFPSMHNLVAALDAYDHTKPMYIGSLSEALPQIGTFGLIAFGGAGVFLSRPLLSEITNVYDECERTDYTGDRRIANCVYMYTSTRLTVDHRLHQLDLMPDASGFFESGRELPLSVHHWKSWFKADMPKISMVSDVCGDSCLLRRFHFSDNWILTTGFSVVQYSYPYDVKDLTMEMTWEENNGAKVEQYLHELGPLRLKDEMKKSYALEDAKIEESGVVTQWLVKRDKSMGDEVLELTWRRR